MDTVPLDGPSRWQENGLLSNRHEAILAPTTRRPSRRSWPPCAGCCGRVARDGVELLFTTGEEQALQGAKSFDTGSPDGRLRLRLRPGYPIGEIVIASPTYYRSRRASAARPRTPGSGPRPATTRSSPRRGRSRRCRSGRLDPETTANVGRIQGGTAANVVAERCNVELETRSLDAVRAAQVVTEMVDALGEAASDSECDVETSVERLFRGYRLPRTAPAVEVAAAALARTTSSRSYINERSWQRRERLHPGRAAGREPRQRHGREPPAGRVGDGRRARDDARGHVLPAYPGRLPRGRDEARRLMERLGGEIVWEGRLHRVRVDRFRYDDGEEADAGDRRASRRGGRRGPRRRARLPGATAARGGRRAGAAGAARRGSSTRRARARSRRRSASSPRRSARARAAGSTSRASTPRRLHRRAVPRVHGDRPLRRAADAGRERAHRDRRASRWPSWTSVIRRLPRLEDARGAAVAAGVLTLSRGSCLRA